MSTAVMTLGSLQQLQPAKKMVMMLSPPHDMPAQLVQPSNGACVIVSANAYPASPPHFTNLDAQAAGVANNNNAKTKNNNLNKVSRVGGGAVQKTTAAPRTSVVVTASPATTAASAAAADALRCKRRIQFSQGSDRVTFTGHQTASVARRNARERNRVKQVNNGFATLRSHIPPAIAAALQEETPVCERPTGRSAKDKEAAKKLSKVETLRMAVEYIRRLQILLNETNNENAAPGTPVSVKTESVVLPGE
ncbi:hypothetical protein ONE63_011193 [Megalurothrips usitatus]|uniref:BHLH domain-containing protein n=1 Tax=Megalurothrips usitatus TaxID=439358 RepID=A0AAV7X6C5_9NEOP|nr:hypothetical protein ONE63_011193 [Megalurothrips usitatus]